jgi:hypothetical protein
MRDADETIQRLLAGLRDAEPSAGMQRRILEAMEAREAAAAAPLWRRLRSSWRLHPAAMSLASGVVATGALIVAIAVHQHWSVPADTRSHVNTAVGRTTQPEAVAQKAPIMPRRLASRGSLRRPGEVSAVPQTQAASFPAPPLPLTEQERLLLRLAHRRDPEDTAILNPAVQAAQSAKATEQFQQFFTIDATQMRSQIE